MNSRQDKRQSKAPRRRRLAHRQQQPDAHGTRRM